MKLNAFLMNSYKDFCKNACALMAKLNQGLSIYSIQAMSVHLTKHLWLFEVADY